MLKTLKAVSETNKLKKYVPVVYLTGIIFDPFCFSHSLVFSKVEKGTAGRLYSNHFTAKLMILFHTKFPYGCFEINKGKC